METASFEVLCASVCEIAGVDIPALSQDEYGITAFTIAIDGVVTSILHQRSAPEAIIVATRLGAVEAQDDYRACRTLMQTNFLMLGEPSAPCAGRNPVTGEFVLHFTCPLNTASGTGVYERAMRMTELALEWEQGIAPEVPAAAGDTISPTAFA